MKDEIRMTVRLPRDAVEFLDGMADHNFTSRNAEIVRSIRELKFRVEARASRNDDGVQIGTLSPSSSISDPVGSRGLATERPLEGHP